MNDFTFLTKKQIFGDKKLEILEKYGKKSVITDFSILLGGYCSKKGENKKNRSGIWMTKSPHEKYQGYNIKRLPKIYLVDEDGKKFDNTVIIRAFGARPATSYSSISKFCSNKIVNKMGIIEVEYGEYPQTVVDKELSKELEEEYLNQKLKETGKTYTTDSFKQDCVVEPFKERKHIEYEYNNKKYIRYIANCNYTDDNQYAEELSNGQAIEKDKPYWVEVEPIKWMIDEKADIALSKKIIFSGVQFERVKDYLECIGYDDKSKFKNTDIKKFMDKYFSKDILTNHLKEKIEDYLKKENKEKGTSTREIIKGLKIELGKLETESYYLKHYIARFGDLTLKEKILFIQDVSAGKNILKKLDEEIAIRIDETDNTEFYDKEQIGDVKETIDKLNKKIEHLRLVNNNVRSFIEKFNLLPLKEKISFLNTASSRSKFFTDIDNEFSITNGNPYINQNQEIEINNSSRHR